MRVEDLSLLMYEVQPDYQHSPEEQLFAARNMPPMTATEKNLRQVAYQSPEN